jgi:hypothetical protein
MTSATLGARAESGDTQQNALQRYAMLSVYYRSLGSQLESRGAPVMAVPPEVRPLPLDEALGHLKGSKERLWDAYWRIVRAAPVEGWKTRSLARRYPPALIEAMRDDGIDIRTLDEFRQDARANAHLLAAALNACAEQRWDEADALAKLLEVRSERDEPGLGQVTRSALGVPAHELVRSLADPVPYTDPALESEPGSEPITRERRADELHKLQADVGLSLNDFVADFLDTVAFARFKWHCGAPDSVLTSSCIVRQDTSTLTTTATVTSLVDGEFEVLARVLDPLGWPRCSDVIKDTYYLRDPFDPVDPKSKMRKGPLGRGLREPHFMFEHVQITWGLDNVQTGWFNNVLVIHPYTVKPGRRTISMHYRLARSIDSRILWDQRDGGILIDEGYILVRPVGRERLRMTVRKVLKFSDRTPYSSAPGWLDFGQMLNYLAPASITWWLETELYSAECTKYGGTKKLATARAPTSEGAG